MKPTRLVGATLLIGITLLAPNARADATAGPKTPPTTRPAADVDALIRQLGDDDFHVRASATQQLKSIGKAAVPALQEARKSQDSEVHARVEEIIQEIERPIIIPDPVPHALARGAQMMKMSVANGVKTVDIKQRGRTIHIDETANGIVMTVTGQLDGKEVTKVYKVRTAEQLMKEKPEAFALYRQYAGNQNGIMLGRFLAPVGGRLGIGGPEPEPPATRPAAKN